MPTRAAFARPGPVPAVPRRQRSYAALRLPRCHRPRLCYSLAFGLPRCRCSSLRRRVRIDERARLGVLAALRIAVAHRGTTRVSQVPGSSVAHAPWSNTPPISSPSRPITTTTMLPSRFWALSAIGMRELRSRIPAAHALACLRIDAVVTHDVARLAAGLPGSALAGRD